MKRVIHLISYLALATAIVALVVTPVSSGANPKGKPFVELQGQIVEVQGEVSSLQDQIDALVGQVESIEDRVTASENAIATLETENTNLQAQLDAHGGSISAMQSEIDALEAQNASLQQQIDDNLGDIAACQAQIDENVATIESLNLAVGEIASLQAQIDNNNLLIQGLTGDVDTINGILTLKQDILDGQCPYGQSLREIQPDGSIACEYDNHGVSGISVYWTYRSTYVHNGYYATLETYCGSGYTAVGGGFDAYLMYVIENKPSWYNNGWRVRVLNRSGFGNYMLTYVKCMRWYYQ
jgi:peptidoglycan hydrolase CwlO-like protein